MENSHLEIPSKFVLVILLKKKKEKKKKSWNVSGSTQKYNQVLQSANYQYTFHFG